MTFANNAIPVSGNGDSPRRAIFTADAFPGVQIIASIFNGMRNRCNGRVSEGRKYQIVMGSVPGIRDLLHSLCIVGPSFNKHPYIDKLYIFELRDCGLHFSFSQTVELVPSLFQ